MTAANVATSWIIAPTILPAITAAVMILVWRRDIQMQRILSVASTIALLGIALFLYGAVSDGQTDAYRLGAWPAPFGIVLVLDRLSTTMLVLTAGLALAVLLYAIAGWDKRGRHFHTLFHFQLLGLNGAFLTGDIFNLFVFFEVMLIASYGLMLHGGGARRLRAGFQYVAINLIASSLFLIAVALIYGVAGTLNMADLAVKAREVTPDNQALLQTGALLLLLVFAIKAAFVPLHWWLPATYAAASAPVAALFAIMTKVGAYAIIRVFGTVFGDSASGDTLAAVVAPWILPAAILTLAAGTAGILASRRLLDLAAFNTVASMGILLIAIGQFDADGLTAALYYLVHSTIAGAALFLVVDLIAERRGDALDALVPRNPISQAPIIGTLFFLIALAVIGLPPLSGFIGKLLVLNATYDASQKWLIWAAILVASLMMTIAFSRAGSMVFWKVKGQVTGPTWATAHVMPMIVVALLVAASASLAVFAGPMTKMFQATAVQALNTPAYVEAVLGRRDNVEPQRPITTPAESATTSPAPVPAPAEH
ncbi:monovalent cation/H+ antiporter subunit D [Methyloceanibacter sp.]|uniref:monovalent cation/H+ antiporter subunit D n=1 Tax=Methyloceanibacter sp. TaxID=1965321 RepID=UPI0020853E9F|nr:monovalent cation/H+ antiporter subunit D [Methyloceanibacter sp.]GFO82510.1 MAG: monovalent cation/H+ antiporter subunit D [Methyloceanibacter sp.]HML91948.1 monovalent cation/H+ antiporter subunit D [Methyloceanibacter sp.]